MRGNLRPNSILGSATGQTLVVNGLTLVAGFLASVILTRALGPVGRGQLAASQLWPVFLSYIGTTGVGPAVLYYSARADVGPITALASSFRLAMCQILLIAGAGYLIIPVIIHKQDPYVITMSRWCLIILVAAIPVAYVQSALQGTMRITAFNGLRLFVPLGNLVGVVILTGDHALTFTSAAWLFISLNLAVLVGALVILWRLDLLFGRASAETARGLLRFGIKAFAGDISALTNLRLDQVLIAAWLPARELGLYVAALSICQLVIAWSTSVRMVLQARLAQDAPPDERARIFEAAVRRYLLVGGVGTICFAAVLPIVLTGLFGNQFHSSIPSAEVLLVATLVLGVKDILGGAMYALGRPWIASRAEIGGAILTLLLLPLLLHRSGILGAAWTSLIVYTAQTTALAISCHRQCGLSIQRGLRRAAAGSPPGRE